MKYKFWNIVSTDIYTPYAGAAGNVLYINGNFTNSQLNYYL
jgi:hypothetical protein